MRRIKRQNILSEQFNDCAIGAEGNHEARDVACSALPIARFFGDIGFEVKLNGTEENNRVTLSFAWEQNGAFRLAIVPYGISDKQSYLFRLSKVTKSEVIEFPFTIRTSSTGEYHRFQIVDPLDTTHVVLEVTGDPRKILGEFYRQLRGNPTFSQLATYTDSALPWLRSPSDEITIR